MKIAICKDKVSTRPWNLRWNSPKSCIYQELKQNISDRLNWHNQGICKDLLLYVAFANVHTILVLS